MIVRHKRMAAAALLVVTYLYFVLHAQAQSAAMTVMASSVKNAPVTRSIAATGSVVAWREIPVGAEGTGLAVTEIAVDEGDRVVKGQILARLNQDRIKAEMLKQEAAIGELEASLASAKSDATRVRSVASGVISVQAVEQRETQVKTTAAKLKAAQAQLLEIETRRRQTEIVAPAAGMIASRAVTIGQVVQSGTEVFRLIQDARVEVDARVPESDLLAAAVGQSAKIFGPSGRSEQGIVRIISPIVDPKTRLGTVRIALSGDSQLKPGMFARVEISVEHKIALTVPLKAVVWHDAKAHVFEVGPGNLVSLTEIKIGHGTADNVEVLQGLDAGDRIVTQGAGLLSDGDVVAVETASMRAGAMQ